MPATTDLSWTDYKEAFEQLGMLDVLILDAYGNPTKFDVFAVIGNEYKVTDGSPATSGIVKFLSKCLEAGKHAQDKANTGKATGEKLAAFPAPTLGGATGTLVPVSRSLVTRHDLTSTGKIVGANI